MATVEEVIAQAERIGTYATSIMPDEDCCSLFVPRSPATKVYPGQVEPLEAELDVEGLVDQAVAGAELFEYHHGKALDRRAVSQTL